MINNLTHFSLCSGIGGIDLAAEWAGFETVAQCEINDYASKVLAKNFPGVFNFGDIRTITTESIRSAGIESGGVTALSAGFPCQPYSLAGLGKGDGDERDLWNEVVRVIRIVKPKWFVGENTPGLFSRENQRYFARVVNDLSALGFNVSWGIWGAYEVGAVHKRDRVFILAYSDGKRYSRYNPKRYEKIDSVYRTSSSTEISFNSITKRIYTVGDCEHIQQSNGVSTELDEIRCLGNAVVPQQVYPLWKAIADYELDLK